MKTGDTVKVYEDPITETRLEGKAKLVRTAGRKTRVPARGVLVDWMVRFVDDPEQEFLRSILSKEGEA